jgi:uncharacterized protein (TIGR02145 family)
MKNFIFYLLLFFSLISVAQTQQNINKNTGTVSNAISTIDSIRFTGSSTNMEVVLQNGTVVSHPISDILNVNFIISNQNSCDVTDVLNPNLNYGSMTDQEGTIYKTIIIGSQEWMAENLNTSVYRNGDAIATNLTVAEWENTLNTQIGAWVFNNNDSQYVCPYGKLYNWYAVVDTRHVCPTGWHEPTDGEWTTLIDYLGGELVAGGKMKSTGTQYWLDPNQDATNESGFSGLPGGVRIFSQFFNFGNTGYWWSSSENGTIDAWERNIGYNNGIAYRGNGDGDKVNGLSVRCLRD